MVFEAEVLSAMDASLEIDPFSLEHRENYRPTNTRD